MKLRACNDKSEPCPYYRKVSPTTSTVMGNCLRNPSRQHLVGWYVEYGCGEHPAVVAEREEAIGAARERGRESAAIDMKPTLSWYREMFVKHRAELDARKWQTGYPLPDCDYLVKTSRPELPYAIMYFDEGDGWGDPSVTHWQPLPEGPNSE